MVDFFDGLYFIRALFKGLVVGIFPYYLIHRTKDFIPMVDKLGLCLCA